MSATGIDNLTPSASSAGALRAAGGDWTSPSFNDRRQRPELQPLASQRRDAYRVNLRLPVYVDAPMEMFCELEDMSVLGLRFDRELPCTPGIKVRFRLEIPSYGASLKPMQLELQASVVRVERGHTGLRFVDLDRPQSRAVHNLVTSQQRMILAARRAHLDRLEGAGAPIR